MQYKRFFLLIVCMQIGLSVNCQQKTDSIFNVCQQKFIEYPKECIYLQTSKDIYETGEDIWFKAYQFDTQNFGMSEKSKTLYLQMFDSNDSVVWKEKYPINKGMVQGHVYIDSQLAEGIYYLQGYTKYSFYRNDSSNVPFSRMIKVVKNISHVFMNEHRKDSCCIFNMFPEGGNLVSNIPANLVFKSADRQGTPIDIEGALYQDNESLCTVRTIHNGMGNVLFTPLAGKNYKIVLKNGDCYSLPHIYPQGISMQLTTQNENHLSFIISKSKKIANQYIYLVGQMRGSIHCIAMGQLSDSLKITIPLKNFPNQGISEFTLLDEQLLPIAERLVYIHPEKKLYITATLDKKEIVNREKTTIRIKVVNENKEPVQANLCLSIYDKAYHMLPELTNIMTFCYLSSQIKGKIFDPTYYFNENNTNRFQALDLLLLTQGWRRYIWEMQGYNTQGEIFLSDEIIGKQVLGNKRKNSMQRNSEQLIQISGPDGNSMFICTDSTGRFNINTNKMLELRGGYIYLRPMLSKELKPRLEVVDYFPVIDSVKKTKDEYNPIIPASESNKETLFVHPIVSADSTILLNEVTVTAKGKKLFRDKFMGKLDSLAKINMDGPYVCGCGFLQNYMPGYDAHPYWKPCDFSNKRTKPVEGKSYVIVKYKHLGGNAFEVEEYRNIEYHGPIYNEEELLKMNNLWKAKGYYPFREFYQPDDSDMQLSTPDARNTLLWAPAVSTDANGEAEISFYCSDINTEFIGIIEGVDGISLLGNKQFEFRVLRY